MTSTARRKTKATKKIRVSDWRDKRKQKRSEGTALKKIFLSETFPELHHMPYFTRQHFSLYSCIRQGGLLPV